MITLFRIYLSASNSQGFGPNATVTVLTLDIGEFTVLRLVTTKNQEAVCIALCT